MWVTNSLDHTEILVTHAKEPLSEAARLGLAKLVVETGLDGSATGCAKD